MYNKIKRIFEENKKRQELKKICLVAEELLEIKIEAETHPIYLLIKELVDLEYNKVIYKTISTHDDHKVPQFSSNNLLPYEEKKYGNYLYENFYGEQITFGKLVDESRVSTKESILLGNDPIIARPWNIWRLTRAMDNIQDKWIQDNNHQVSLWLPYGVTFVSSGNHSITVGYLRNTGSVTTDDVYNVGEIHDYIYTDGIYYFRKSDDSICAEVTNFNLAVVFAIGGLIHKKRFSGEGNINFHSQNVNHILTDISHKISLVD